MNILFIMCSKGRMQMDRLTQWTGYEWIARQERLKGKTVTDRDIYNKLAEYEDIGIEPERLKEFLGNFGISIVTKNTKLMNELQENEEIISKMAKRLKSFEENTFNSGWIPVSESLPGESSQRVIVTLENGCVCEVFFINDKFKFIETLKGGGLEEVPHNNPVIAWQPLPEAYKG